MQEGLTSVKVKEGRRCGAGADGVCFGNLNVSGLSRRANSLGSVAAQLATRIHNLHCSRAAPRVWVGRGGPAARLQS